MKIIKARIPAGNTVFIREVEIHTPEEAKEILRGQEFDVDWTIGGSIYDVDTCKWIGWMAQFNDGTGIYVEVKK